MRAFGILRGCSIVGLLFVLTTVPGRSQPLHALLGGYAPSFGQLRDTLLLLDSVYLEVRLDQQMIYQRFRSGRIEKYPCSTGNPVLKDAIATREGIFSIQWKAKKHFSTQFEVYLNYWMPFNGGIGFHGLQGRSYYKYLGRRRSSHGCVRISNETGARLFGTTPTGSVVYVHSGSPARLLLFADTTRKDYHILDDIDIELLDRRLEAVRKQDWRDSSLTTRLALPPRSRFTETIGVGSVRPKTVTQFPLRLIRIPPTPIIERVVISPIRPQRAAELQADG